MKWLKVGIGVALAVAASFVVERRGALAILPLDPATAKRRLEWLTHTLKGDTSLCAWTSVN